MRYSIPCSPQQPCHHHRVCDYCARLRQRKIAELAASRHRPGHLTFATFTGLSPSTVPLARSLRPGSGGLWTVEIGEKMRGLHVNLLFDSQSELFAEDLAAAAAIRGAEVWARSVDPADIRNIAAYISKRSGFPEHREYAGHLQGTWGSWRSARQISQQQRLAPLLSAAAHEAELRALDIQPPASSLAAPAPNKTDTGAPLTRDQYRALAVDNLPILRQLLSS